MPTQPVTNTGYDLPLIIQSLIALILILTLAYLFVTGGNPSDVHLGIVSLIVGHYFGSRLPASAVKQQAQAIQAFSSALQ